MEKSPVRSDAYFPEWKPAFSPKQEMTRVMPVEMSLGCAGPQSIEIC